MILASSIHRHPVDIHTIDDLARETGLTVREITGSLSTRKTRRTLACKRMVAECCDDAILSRCSTYVVQMLNGEESIYA